jgi:hypothetical protein
MSIELERAAIERARAATRSSITDLERSLGIVPAFSAAMKAVELLNALDRIDKRFVARERAALHAAAERKMQMQLDPRASAASPQTVARGEAVQP